MRFAQAAVVSSLIAVSAPAMAASTGLPTIKFVQTWTALPTGHFTASGKPSAPVREFNALAVPDQPVVDRLLDDAIASAADNRDRRSIAVYEMATTWDQNQRTALDRLRMAQTNYSTAAGANDARDARFVALLSSVGDPTTGRSVAAADGTDPDEALTAAYANSLKGRDAAGRAKIEASQNAWLAYREAFVDFARERGPDSVDALKGELTRRRTAELAASAN